MNPKIAIILLNYNGKNDTLECLESLKKVHYPAFEIIVVDNASKDGSLQAFKKAFPDITYIENKENLGFSEGNNQGLFYAMKKNFSYFFLLNNDTVVNPDILQAFVQAAQKNPDAGIFGGKIFRYYERDTIDHFGGIWNRSYLDFDVIGLGKKDVGFESYKKVDYICGCAFFLTKKIIQDIGYLETQYFLIWEDTDYCFKAKKSGYSLISVPDAKIYHKVSSSFTGGKPQMHYYWWRGRLLWLKRNGGQLKPYRYALLCELWKLFRHFMVKSLTFPFSSKKKKEKRRYRLKRYQAGIKGVLHYLLGRFGNSY